MSGPPRDVPASQLWTKLQQLPRPVKLVDFPRLDEKGEAIGQVAMQVLTQQEQMLCTVDAEAFTRKYLKDGKKEELGYERLFQDAICVEFIFRACRDPADHGRTAFPTPNALREQLTTEECIKLFEQYLIVQMELSPNAAGMTHAEFEAWIDRLVEAESAAPLVFLSSDEQKILMLYMAFQLRSLRMGNSSAGTPPEPTSTEFKPAADSG